MPTVRKTIIFAVSDALIKTPDDTGAQTYFWPLNLQSHFSSQVQSAQNVAARKVNIDTLGRPQVAATDKTGFKAGAGLTSVSAAVDQNAIAFEVDYDVTVA